MQNCPSPTPLRLLLLLDEAGECLPLTLPPRRLQILNGIRLRESSAMATAASPTAHSAPMPRSASGSNFDGGAAICRLANCELLGFKT